MKPKLTLRQISCQLRNIMNADGLYCGPDRVLKIQFCETTRRIYATFGRGDHWQCLPVVFEDVCGVVAPTASGKLLKNGNGNDQHIWRLIGDKRADLTSGAKS